MLHANRVGGVRRETQVGFVYGAIRMTRDWETPDKHRHRRHQTLAKIMKFSASRRARVAEKIHAHGSRAHRDRSSSMTALPYHTCRTHTPARGKVRHKLTANALSTFISFAANCLTTMHMYAKR